MLDSGTIRESVFQTLALAGVTFNAIHAGQRKRDNWDCDAWLCTLTKGKACEDFEFFTGLGHRDEPNALGKLSARHSFPGLTDNDIKRRTNYGLRYLAALESKRQPKAPHPADLLHSLILDASASEQSFANWCDEYGYDSDSRKALSTYEACQANTDKLRRILTREQFAELQSILQDY